jgi:hypothetical protein
MGKGTPIYVERNGRTVRMTLKDLNRKPLRDCTTYIDGGYIGTLEEIELQKEYDKERSIFTRIKKFLYWIYYETFDF